MSDFLGGKPMDNLYPNELEVYEFITLMIDKEDFSIKRYQLRILLDTIKRLDYLVDVTSYPGG